MGIRSLYKPNRHSPARQSNKSAQPGIGIGSASPADHWEPPTKQLPLRPAPGRIWEFAVDYPKGANASSAACSGFDFTALLAIFCYGYVSHLSSLLILRTLGIAPRAIQ